MRLYFICVFVFCAPIVLGRFSNPLDDIIHEYEDDCLPNGASYASLEEVRSSRVVADNEQMKEFARCMLQKFNVMNSDGSVNEDVQEYKIPTYAPNETQEVNEKCKTLSGNNPNDTARLIMNCYLEVNQMVLASTPLIYL